MFGISKIELLMFLKEVMFFTFTQEANIIEIVIL